MEMFIKIASKRRKKSTMKTFAATKLVFVLSKFEKNFKMVMVY